MSEIPNGWRITVLRAEIGELAGTIHQLRRAGLDSAVAQVLLSRKCAELEGLMKCQSIGKSPKADHTA